MGIFYFAWHNSDQHKVFDVTKILRENPDDLWSMDPKNPIAPRATYYFNEPLYGYYSSSDPYVIRKHIELFIAAGIDFIAYDFTNFQIYWDPLYRMLDLLIEYGNAGWKVPQVMFFTKKDCANQIPQLYEKLYMEEKYSHLWFRGSGSKPYLIGEPKDIPEEYHDYFNLRYSFWPSDPYREDGWPYVDKVRPQRVFTNLVSVSVAQHTGGAFSWSIKDRTTSKDRVGEEDIRLATLPMEIRKQLFGRQLPGAVGYSYRVGSGNHFRYWLERMDCRQVHRRGSEIRRRPLLGGYLQYRILKRCGDDQIKRVCGG